MGSAWFSSEEDKKGALERGKFADLAVLSADYFTVLDDEIAHLESALTVTGGPIVHASGPYQQLDPPKIPVNPSWSPIADERLRPAWADQTKGGPTSAATPQAGAGCECS